MAKLSKIYLKKLWTGYIKKFPNKQKQKKNIWKHTTTTLQPKMWTVWKKWNWICTVFRSLCKNKEINKKLKSVGSKTKGKKCEGEKNKKINVLEIQGKGVLYLKKWKKK